MLQSRSSSARLAQMALVQWEEAVLAPVAQQSVGTLGSSGLHWNIETCSGVLENGEGEEEKQA